MGIGKNDSILEEPDENKSSSYFDKTPSVLLQFDSTLMRKPLESRNMRNYKFEISNSQS